MNQGELVLLVIRALETAGVPYMITGCHASAYYGEPRFTRDIDIVADFKEEHVKEFVRFFPTEEFYCDEDMIRSEIQRRGQFNIVHPSSGIKIDIILTKATPFSRMEFGRRKHGLIMPGQKADFASPEDVIIKKMEFYKEGESEKHLRDITGILKVSGDSIDYDYINKWAHDLGLQEIWDAILKRIKK